jgi:hypothetical protein
MPELKGFDVWVEVNGVRLEEYKVEASGDKVACWIPSEAGKVNRLISRWKFFANTLLGLQNRSHHSIGPPGCN